ncbi:hypothetical protein SAMN02927914_00734 [Mesorhizobium qingshengii]|uniref:Uncharacterized protein n=1 Tax=Mesorhizobium qingshengii TaxID=1165689 RepID=A0A1G5VU14_9HYPH|nr:hypothetical protein SAMN02927914_00734 [Mesorhizobium qingshengii]
MRRKAVMCAFTWESPLFGQKLTHPTSSNDPKEAFERSLVFGPVDVGQHNMHSIQWAARFSSERAYCVSGKHMAKKISATRP